MNYIVGVKNKYIHNNSELILKNNTPLFHPYIIFILCYSYVHHYIGLSTQLTY